MNTATIDHTILCQAGPVTVEAEPAAPGLYVYEGPDAISGGACRWRLGHHSGLQIARFPSSEAAHAAAAELTGFTDWTAPADTLRADTIARNQTDRMEFLRLIQDAGGHLGDCCNAGNCARAAPMPDWHPNGGHTGPMCAYVAGMSSRCTCA